MGDEVWVLTAREEDYLENQPRDYNLLGRVDPSITIVRTGVFRPREALLKLRGRIKNVPNPSNQHQSTGTYSESGRWTNWLQRLKDTITDLLTSPDPHIGWLPKALPVGAELIQREGIDIIYATGSPWTSFLLGACLKKLTGRPIALDFRDPWVANPGFLVRSKPARALEILMERKLIAAADAIITNTKELTNSFQSRFQTIPKKHIVSIPNGFEAYEKVDSKKNEQLTLTHAGSLYFSRNPLPLIKAALNLIQKGIIGQSELKLIFLGGIAIKDPELQKSLEEPLLQAVVELVPRLPFREAAIYQNKSDVLFLIQPDFPLQIPRKLYEYMSFRKPILAITNQQGATSSLVIEKDLGIVVENRISEIESGIEELYRKWQANSLHNLPAATCDEFLNSHLAAQLRQTLSSMTSQQE